MSASAEDSPFHAGEQQMQAWAGMAEAMEHVGPRVIRDHMPEQHREFFAELPLLVIGALDAVGQPWASVLVGPPGFMQSPAADRLHIGAQAAPSDPLAGHLRAGAAIGALGIQFHTRRRNRMNGQVLRADAHGLEVQVHQSFGNCPKYIQARSPIWQAPASDVQRERAVLPESARLSDAAVQMIRQADTFFIASAAPGAGDMPKAKGSDGPGGPAAQGVDVSHRGGKPGFVKVDQPVESRTDQADGYLAEAGPSPTVLTVPDFSGNFFFNTLGNLLANPRAGLLFIGFHTGDLLWLSAQADIVHGGPEVAAYAGAQRLLRLRVTGGRRVPGALPLRWTAAQPASQLAATGDWPQAQ